MLHKGHRILALLCAFTLLLLCSPCAVAEDSVPASGVTYEIFVASFSDHNGDGSGDLLGIIDRLDYLTSLGVAHAHSFLAQLSQIRRDGL